MGQNPEKNAFLMIVYKCLKVAVCAILVLAVAGFYIYLRISVPSPQNNRPIEPFLSLQWGVIPKKVVALRGEPQAKLLLGYLYRGRQVWGVETNEYFRFTKSRLTSYECELEIAGGMATEKILLLTRIRAAALSQMKDPDIFITADGITEIIWDDDTMMQFFVMQKQNPIRVSLVLYEHSSTHNHENAKLVQDVRSNTLRAARHEALRQSLAGACGAGCVVIFYHD